jgi:flagellar hook-associated protein 1 FlgK
MPISSFYGLQTSLRGLLAQQRALDTTGHNIANASTAGYSRQEAVMAAAPALHVPAGALQSGAGAQLGSGVDIQDYRRVRDQFLDLQFRAQAMRLGAESTRAEQLGRAETALAEPSDNGISKQLESFWNAWSDVAKAPSDTAAREALIEQSKTLAAAFATVDAQFATVAAQAAGEYDAIVGRGGEIDSIATELAALNATIKSFVSAGEAPNDLMDRRDVLLDRLSSLGQVSVTPGAVEGTLDVGFGDAVEPLVEGTAVTWPQVLTTPGGRLGALRKVGGPAGEIAAYRATLDGVATALADRVNALHAAGAGGTGGPIFATGPGGAAGSLRVVAAPGDLRASTGTAAGANDLALAIAGLRGSPRIDGDYQAFVARVGTDVAEAARQESNAAVLVRSVDDRRQSVSGVALDEEMTNLVRFQRAYQASARAMSTMDEMLDVLINRTGRVGL